MKRLRELMAFIKDVAQDERIPERDKALLTVLVALIASPFDIIPDWIPIFGVMDDFILVAVLLDYLFNQLDQQILLSHYPWDMKSYVRVQKVARMIARITPSVIKDRIWKYKPPVY